MQHVRCTLWDTHVQADESAPTAAEWKMSHQNEMYNELIALQAFSSQGLNRSHRKCTIICVKASTQVAGQVAAGKRNCIRHTSRGQHK